MSLTVTIVYNPTSGSAPGLAELRKLCAQHDVSVAAAITIGLDLKKRLMPHIKRAATIMAVGGDGTLGAVAGLMAGTKAVLIPLPGGSLNNFTKDLGIDQDIEQAFARAITAKIRRIDIAEVNGTYFVNNSGIGIYPRSLRARERFEDQFGKWPAAFIAAIRTLVRYRNYHVRIGSTEYTTPFIFIGNNEYLVDAAGLPNRTRLDGGKLSVMIATSTTRVGIIKLFFAAATGRLHHEASLEAFTAAKLTIGSRNHRHVNVSHDGEVSRLTMPLQYTLHKGALRIRC